MSKTKIALIFNIIFIIVIAVKGSEIFTAKWRVPLSLEDSREDYKFLPVHYSTHNPADDYFYYARIREVLDGYFFSGDHATYEHKSEVTPHKTYSGSFILGALGGIFSKSTFSCYYFNHMVYPFIGIFLLSLLGYLLFPVGPFATLLSLGLFLALPQVERTPNILITQVPFFLFCILLFFKFEKKSPSRILDLGLAFIMGISSIISVPTMILCYSIYTCFVAFNWKKLENPKGYIKIFLLALVVSLPGVFFIVFHSIWGNKDFIYLAAPPISKYSGIHWNQMAPTLASVMSWLLLIPVIFKFRYRGFFLTIYIAFFSAYGFLTLVKGSYVGNYIFFRGGEVLYYFLLRLCPYVLVWSIIREQAISIGFGKWTYSIGLRKYFHKNIRWIKYAIVLCLTLHFAHRSLRHARANLHYREAKAKELFYKQGRNVELVELVKWSQDYFKNDDVLVTFDFDALVNMTVYSAVNSYIPFAHHSPTTTIERNKRFHQILRFHDLDQENYYKIFKEMKPTFNILYAKNPQDVQNALMHLVLFYGKYTEVAMRPDELATYYENYTKETGFTYRATHVLISNVTDAVSGQNSQAKKLFESGIPVFENSRFKVFKLEIK